MHSKEVIQSRLDELKHKYGDWSSNIPLPYGIWTVGNLQLPPRRLKRIVQVANDLAGKPLSECQVLDLGCLDGMCSIEFAKEGANTIGIDVREANIQKAMFCKTTLELENLDFRKDDVRNISVDTYGKFDVIICSGILYHLPAIDAVNLINTMFQMVNRVVIIDTHVALEPVEMVLHDGDELWGSLYREHADDAAPEQKEKALWASADNTFSFWFTRPSLINILNKAGFSSVYECFTPTLIQKKRWPDRCTFVAIKSDACELYTAPSADGLREKYPEKSLAYMPEQKTLNEIENAIPGRKLIKMILRKAIGKIKSKLTLTHRY